MAASLSYAMNCSLEDAMTFSSPCYNPNGNTTFFPSHHLNNTTASPMNPNETPDIFYQNFLNHTRFWVQRVLVPTIMIIGVVGNVITIVIMTRRRMRSSTNNYLAALAIFDMMYLVFTFVLSLSHYPRMTNAENYVYWRLKPFIIMLTDTCSNTSVWLTVTFTVERYIAVCHPMKGKVLCTESRAKKAIVGVFLFCFTFTIPTPFEWKVVENIDMVNNITTLQLQSSEMGENYFYKTIYSWLTVVLFIFTPLLLLAVFNSFLIRSVHLSKVQRNTMTRCGDNRDHSRQENKITIMLIAVVILFFICQLPTACHLLYNSFHQTLGPNELYMLWGLGNIFNFLMSLNAAGNFVLYCLLSQKYRRTFLQIFCPCLKGKITRLHSMYQNTVCSNVDTDSPGGSRRLSVRSVNRLSSPRGSTADLSQSRRGSPVGPRSAFLQVPNANSLKNANGGCDDIDSDEKSLNGECAPCRNALQDPWRKLKRSVGKKEPREQIIPLKGGNKCIVITAPDATSPTSPWSANSVV